MVYIFDIAKSGLSVIIELWMLHFFYQRMLLSGTQGSRRYWSALAVTGGLLLLVSLLPITGEKRTFLCFFIDSIPVLFFGGHLLIKFFAVFLFLATNAGAEALCIVFLNVIEYFVPSLGEYNYIIGVLLSKSLAFILLYLVIMLKKCADYDRKSPLIAVYFAVAVVMIDLLYEMKKAAMIMGSIHGQVYMISSMFLVLLLCLLLFYLFDRHMEAEHIRQEEAVRKTKEALQQDFYRIITEREMSLREARHDYQNILATLHSHLQQEQYTEAAEYLEAMGIKAAKHRSILTGYASLDAILNIKKEAIEEAGILFRYEIDPPAQLRIEEMDLVTLVFNSLDNALEAVQKADPEATNRYIDFLLKIQSGKILLQVRNPIFQPIQQAADGTLLTTKADATQHGIGLKSIHKLVKRYDGIVVILPIEDQIFTIQIMLPN